MAVKIIEMWAIPPANLPPPFSETAGAFLRDYAISDTRAMPPRRVFLPIDQPHSCQRQFSSFPGHHFQLVKALLFVFQLAGEQVCALTPAATGAPISNVHREKFIAFVTAAVLRPH